MLRLLFSRRWLGALALALLWSVACYHLGFWQWHRHIAKVERNDRLDAHYRATPVPLPTDLGAGPFPLADDWTRVEVTGSYAGTGQLTVRNRPLEGAAGSEVVTDFVSADGRHLLVDRGWVPLSRTGAAGVQDVPPLPAGELTLVGWLRPGEKSLHRDQAPGQLSSINIAEAKAQLADAPLLGAYLLVQSEQITSTGQTPVRPLPLSPPDRDLGPHQAYAYQWWVGTIAGFVLVFFGIRREVRSNDPTYVPKQKKQRIWDEEDY